jgi:CBS domain containing-hemolysin-like protein
MLIFGFVALAVVFVACILLDMAVKSLPRQELRRRARAGQDKKAHNLYKLASYGPSFDLLMWLIVTLSALGLILLAFSISGWLVLAIVLADSWLFVFSRRRRSMSRWLWSVGGLLAPPASGLLSLLHPLFSRLTRQGKKPQTPQHSQIYEKEDLIELLDKQKRQPDNRVSEAELNITHSALTFSDKKVADIMTPRAKVKLVAASEPIGPLLMDELHKNGQRRFPVVREASRSNTPDVMGVIELEDLIEHADKGRVKELLKPGAVFVNEGQSLRQALSAFLKNQTHLLMVKNNFEEFVGTLSIEDVIEQILGEPLDDELVSDEQLQVMADLAAKNLPAENSESEVLK